MKTLNTIEGQSSPLLPFIFFVSPSYTATGNSLQEPGKTVPAKQSASFISQTDRANPLYPVPSYKAGEVLHYGWAEPFCNAAVQPEGSWQDKLSLPFFPWLSYAHAFYSLLPLSYCFGPPILLWYPHYDTMSRFHRGPWVHWRRKLWAYVLWESLTQ